MASNTPEDVERGGGGEGAGEGGGTTRPNARGPNPYPNIGQMITPELVQVWALMP